MDTDRDAVEESHAHEPTLGEIPLTPAGIAGDIKMRRMLAEAIGRETLLFRHPRDWRGGEWIWSADRGSRRPRCVSTPAPALRPAPS